MDDVGLWQGMAEAASQLALGSEEDPDAWLQEHDEEDFLSWQASRVPDSESESAIGRAATAREEILEQLARGAAEGVWSQPSDSTPPEAPELGETASTLGFGPTPGALPPVSFDPLEHPIHYDAQLCRENGEEWVDEEDVEST